MFSAIVFSIILSILSKMICKGLTPYGVLYEKGYWLCHHNNNMTCTTFDISNS